MFRMRNAGLLTALFVVSAAPALAPGQIAKQGAGYVFKPKFVKGSVVKYSMSMAMGNLPQGQPNPGRLGATMVQRVKDVKGNIATIEVTTNVLQNGKPMQGQPPQVMTMQYDMKANKPVGGATGTFSGMPTKPIRVGESYKATMPLGGGPMGGQAMQATYKLVGFKNMGGRQVAQLDVTIPQSSSMPMSGKGTLYLLVSDASLWSAAMDMKMNMPASRGAGGQPAQARTMTMSMSIKRV